jgi:hypothetical protein
MSNTAEAEKTLLLLLSKVTMKEYHQGGEKKRIEPL